MTARQIETNTDPRRRTDTDGRFRFPYLRVGPYEITVRTPGFADATRRLTLTVGAAFDLPMRSGVEAVAASVTVSGTATVLEAARSQIAGTVSQAEVASLPLNGRNFLDIALLVPGVSPTNVGSTQLFAETSAVPGIGLSVGSQRNFSNNFIVDGLSANDDAAGLSGMPYGVDAVDQFQVVTSGGQAELGRALGGYVNVVTQSGTNLSRGDLYGYFRDDALQRARTRCSGVTEAADVAAAVRRQPRRPDRPRPHVLLCQRRAAAARSDRAGDDLRTPTSRRSTRGWRRSAIAGSPVVDRHLSESGAQRATCLARSITSSTAAISSASATASTTSTRATRAAPAALNAPSASAGLDNRDQTIAFSNTLTLSPRTVNETRAQFAHSDLLAPPTDPVGPGREHRRRGARSARCRAARPAA